MLVNKPAQNSNNLLPVEGFVRANTLAPLLGIAVVTLWRWSAAGKIPKPVKLGERVTAWRAEDVRNWMNSRNDK
ncbi:MULTISPECIES: helix-turn-helix transcriptional regulator [Aeromonas]|jgi:prophage regulatory protein|uniref:helix-turn-helix transcriptional regulator n=1 Tax=Aeromonas TaxID=642 RepID=UPI00257FE258|nr:AlpA family phage regulatory protein [Aeromonas sp.]